jgi:hypothetical protein
MAEGPLRYVGDCGLITCKHKKLEDYAHSYQTNLTAVRVIRKSRSFSGDEVVKPGVLENKLKSTLPRRSTLA